MKKLLIVLACLALLFVSGCVREGGEPMIYLADTDNGKVIILNDDLEFVDSFNAICFRIEVDAEYIYLAQAWDIYKYLRAAPYTQVDTVGTSSIVGMGSDATHIYIGVSRSVKKYTKAGLNYVNEFDTGHDLPIAGVAVDGTYIYTHDGSGLDLKKFRKSDYGQEWSVDLGGTYHAWLGLDEEGSYLFFVSTPGTGTALSLNRKSDGSNYKRILGVSTHGWYACAKSGFAYVVDYGANQLRKVNLDTEAIVASYNSLLNPRCVAWYPDRPPTAPTELKCNDETNPTGVT